MADYEEIAAILDRISAMLRASDKTGWADQVDDASQRILSPWLTTRAAGIDIIRNFFGGMGSLQDLVFTEEGGNLPEGLAEREANEIFRREMEALYAATHD